MTESSSAAKPYAIGETEGTAFWFAGALMVTKADADATGGSFDLLDQTVPAGYAPPRHVHRHEGRGLVHPRWGGHVLVRQRGAARRPWRIRVPAHGYRAHPQGWHFRRAPPDDRGALRFRRFRTGGWRARPRPCRSACNCGRSGEARQDRSSLRDREAAVQIERKATSAAMARVAAVRILIRTTLIDPRSPSAPAAVCGTAGVAVACSSV